jgi:hypothetical protein
MMPAGGFMKVDSLSKSVLFFGALCLLWSGSSQPLRAQQNYPSHITVFGQSSEAPPAPQKIDPATEADIRQLLDLSGTKATVTRVMGSAEESMRPLLFHSLPPGPYRDQLVRLFLEKLHTKLDAQHVLDMVAPVYAQYFSDAEIKQMIELFKMPVVQKWVSLQPKVQAQLSPAAHLWGREMGIEAMREVLEEHPDLAKELKVAAEAAHQQ